MLRERWENDADVPNFAGCRGARGLNSDWFGDWEEYVCVVWDDVGSGIGNGLGLVGCCEESEGGVAVRDVDRVEYRNWLWNILRKNWSLSLEFYDSYGGIDAQTFLVCFCLCLFVFVISEDLGL